MTTAGLGGIVVEFVFLYHRTVVGPQGIQFFAVGVGAFSRQRLTHNLPAVTVEQHQNGRDISTLDVERASTHVEGLEPVLQILYHLLSNTVFFLVIIAVPSGSVGIDCIAVPTSCSQCRTISTLVNICCFGVIDGWDDPS